jgi:hypothetical protein
MATFIDVWNQALTNLDISQSVSGINDPTPAAGACNRFYDLARQKVLEAAHWDFATKAPALALVLDQNTLPTNQIIYPGWRYVYAKPIDCFRFLAVTTQYGLRVNPFLAFWWRAGAMDCSAGSWGPFRPPFREMLDQIGTPPNNAINILTDQDSAYGVYVTDVTNVNLWTAAFRDAVAWNLAVYIAGPLSANQKAKENASKMAVVSIPSALAVALNERQQDPYPDSPAITARN